MEGGFGRVAAQTVIGRMASAFGAMLFPHECVVCGSEGRILCRGCQEEISAPLRGVFLCPVCAQRSPLGSPCPGSCRARSALDGTAALAPYGHPALRSLLHEYKYGGVAEAGTALEAVWSSWIVRQRPLLAALTAGAVVMPVPLHYFRQARRGFNQSDRFAAVLGGLTGARFESSVLERRFRWRSQAMIAAPAARRANAGGSVRMRPGASVGGRVVLVDDVLTTGSTVQECARVLKQAGAAEVWALTLLRG